MDRRWGIVIRTVFKKGGIMINEKIEKGFNEQIKHELDSAYIYLSMAAYMRSRNLDGMAHWLEVQCREETKHAEKFYTHINDRQGKVRLMALDAPKTEWSSPVEVWKDAYKHEQFITGKINSLVKLAAETNDYSSTPLLNWFNDEQIEEEQQTAKVVQTLEMIGSSGAGLVMLDKELGKREE